MSKQTAVELLIDKLSNYDLKMIELFSKEIEQALALEKQQIIDARVTAPLLSEFDKTDYTKEAEKYYNETYAKV
jgi:hypothetical protein